MIHYFKGIIVACYTFFKGIGVGEKHQRVKEVSMKASLTRFLWSNGYGNIGVLTLPTL